MGIKKGMRVFKKVVFSIAIFLLSFFVSSLFFSSCEEEKVTIASVNFNSDIEWFREAAVGMKDAAEKYNVEFVNVDTYYDIESEFESAKNLASENVDAVVFCPLDFEKSACTAEYLNQCGIPVVTWNTLIDTPVVKSRIVSDSVALGSQTGDYLVGYFSAHNLSGIKAAMISNYSYTVSADRCNGFKSSVKPLLDSEKMKIVCEIPCELAAETKRNVHQLLEKNPDIQLIWCWNQTTLLACLSVLKETNRTDILLCGADLSLDLAKEMLNPDSNLIVVTTQQPYLMGFTAFENAIVAYSGRPVEENVVIPVITYTKDNTESLKRYIESQRVR